MSIFSMDYESTSLCDIKLGAFRYSSDPSTRILMFAIAKDAGSPVLWRFDQPDLPESRMAIELLEEAIASGDPIYAHSAQFEVALTRYRAIEDLGIKTIPTLDQWRCTQAMCNRAAIPPSLAEAAKFLKLFDQKDKKGKALIEIFSDQSKMVTLEAPEGAKDEATIKIHPTTGRASAGRKPTNRKSPSPIMDETILWDWRVTVGGEKMTIRRAWELFLDYCRQDVVVEQAIHAKLSRFELTGDELASFQFDLEMNYRGVPVNRKALAHAWKLVQQYQTRLQTRFKNTCDLEASQTAKVLAYLKAEGYSADNLQAETVSAALDNPEGITPKGLDVLRMRSLLSFAAIKKIPTMLNCACPDGRVRGTTQWHGARTGRATGRLTQMQNVRKATIKDSDLAYQMLCEEATLEEFECFWDSFLEVVASCTRHFIQHPELMMLDADFIGVEARITPWLCGDSDKINSILSGVDQYRALASQIFSVAYDAVTKAQRTIAKPGELGCCFGVSGRGLKEGLAKPPYNTNVPLELCKRIVKVYRENHPKTVQCWRDIEAAAKEAIRSGAITQVADGKLAFGKIVTAGIPYLVMRLPSGRRMFYPKPQLKIVFKPYDEEEMVEEPWKREKKGYNIEQISFEGKVEGKGMWGRVHTWGSRLFENAVQATGADLLNYGCIEASREGYEVVMIIHDQALALNTQPLGGFVEALCRKQPWAETFPLEADGNVVPYYLKD